jgi:hypothetical protein
VALVVFARGGGWVWVVADGGSSGPTFGPDTYATEADALAGLLGALDPAVGVLAAEGDEPCP